jgi:hypothetical protein
MKDKQLFGVLFAIGILTALIGATLMWFGIAPVPLRITIVIIGTSLIALSNPIAKSKNI